MTEETKRTEVPKLLIETRHAVKAATRARNLVITASDNVIQASKVVIKKKEASTTPSNPDTKVLDHAIKAPKAKIQKTTTTANNPATKLTDDIILAPKVSSKISKAATTKRNTDAKVSGKVIKAPTIGMKLQKTAAKSRNAAPKRSKAVVKRKNISQKTAKAFADENKNASGTNIRIAAPKANAKVGIFGGPMSNPGKLSSSFTSKGFSGTIQFGKTANTYAGAKIKAPKTNIFGKVPPKITKVTSKTSKVEKTKKVAADSEKAVKAKDEKSTFATKRKCTDTLSEENDAKKPKIETVVIMCNICLEEASILQEKFISLVLTECGHLFCNPCLQRWNKKYLNCPLCRRFLFYPPMTMTV